MDNANLFEDTEEDFWGTVEMAHNEGMSYRDILRSLLIICEELAMKADADYYLRGG